MWAILCTSFFQKYISVDDIVLDIPCGYCDFINEIRAKKKIGVDINPDSGKYANKDVRFVLANSVKIPLAEETVGVVFVSNFFEHLTKDQITRTIDEFQRILTREGKVIMLQPNIRWCAKDYWRFFDHITPIDDRALDEVFGVAGFLPIKKIVRFLPFTAKGSSWVALPILWMYLRLPVLWYFFGKQSMLIYQKT